MNKLNNTTERATGSFSLRDNLAGQTGEYLGNGDHDSAADSIVSDWPRGYAVRPLFLIYVS